MIYDKTYLKLVVSKYLPIHKSLGHSKLADVIHTAGDLNGLSHRQLRKYISELREENTIKGTGNKLVIGDLHEPFSLDEYLDFNIGLYKKYDCDSVVFIGDVIDSSAASYHESDPDGLSAGDELYWAKQRLKRWYQAFPGTIENPVNILLGNHDLIFARKVKSAGLPKNILKSFGDIIEAPETWIFHTEDQVYDNVLYSHGNIGNAYTKALQNRMSVVQGHLHSQSFIQYSVSIKDVIYGLNVGCGIDHHKYAFAYGQPFPKKPVISSAVVLNHGKLPILELMSL